MFWCCSKDMGDDTNCKFFEWVDDTLRGVLEDAGPVKDCKCGHPAIRKSVMKEGMNKGRMFLCCSKKMGDSTNCKFFEWTDEGQELEGQQDAGPLCKCRPKKHAVRRTVNKEGPNKGKMFWVCSNRMGETCKFFEWADDSVTDSIFKGRYNSKF